MNFVLLGIIDDIFKSRYGDKIVFVFVFVDHVNLPYVRIAYSDPDDGTFFRSVFYFSIFKYHFRNSLTRSIVRLALGKKERHKFTKHTARLDRPESGTTGSIAKGFFIFYFDLEFLNRVPNSLALHAQIGGRQA
jgi:hypothetical protein